MTSNFLMRIVFQIGNLIFIVICVCILPFGGYYKIRVFQVKYVSVGSVNLTDKVSISWNYSIESVK